jgi:conjugative relaxase-like TrwC/TraI family protein
VAWMRMMGAHSVAYHEHTVAGRGDDPVANALDYYASRGETPMSWGGSGAALLGLEGEVDMADWRALFGAGGPHHPESGERLVACTRPGMELVVSPGKSVAELGVIGRAEDMHAILDAETAATLEYLDQVTREQGGRRGRAQLRTGTDGLTWAVSRHATTRSGDPQPHDHVLVANVVAMGDARGGWKALDTALLRDHLHAATAIGRMAAAAKAVELGYGIEADPGPSGRLGSFAISGVPKEAWEVHATRSAQIDAAVGRDASYQARSMAARTTRDRKEQSLVEDLLPRWRAELADAGYPPAELAAAAERAGRDYARPGPELVDQLAEELLSPGGRLAAEKAFDIRDTVVAVAPHLHGLPVSMLDAAVQQVLSDARAVALPAVAGARGPVWSAACVLEDERRVAELADNLVERQAPVVPAKVAATAVLGTELARGARLNERQAEVAKALLTSGHSLDLLIGVAGSGKTSTLSAVRAGFEAAGYTVIGAATSGQAAKALESGAGVSSRTVASLTWRLEHHRQALGARHVLVVDEAGMTPDAEMAKLLGAVAAARARAIVVGDYRQLDAVGPGGALEALASRHPGHVWALTENVRQSDPAERHALDQLRAGEVPMAAAWYVMNGRVHPARTQGQAMLDMVRSWAYDVAEGKDALLVAYHRNAVEALNGAARLLWEQLGHLSGPELEVEGGRRYRAGDRVVTLSPGPDGAWVTSQRAVVSSVDPTAGSLVAITPEGTQLHMGPRDIGADKLAYAYSVTAHRSQGQTVDVTHALEDGGGRELAYVAMSRARGESHVHLVAPDIRHAARRLAWAWGQERRQHWAQGQSPEERLAGLYHERQELRGSLPPDRRADLDQARQQLRAVEQDAADLHAGTGRWAGAAPGMAARNLHQAAAGYQRASADLDAVGLGPWGRHKARCQLREASAGFDSAKQAWEQHGQPYADQLEAARGQLAHQAAELEQAQQAREVFLAEHPDVPHRLAELGRAIEHEQQLQRRQSYERVMQREQARHAGIWREPDTGLGIDL